MQHDIAPNEATNESARVYEAGLLLVPSIAQEMVPKAFDEIKSFITKAGGSVIAEEEPALRTLAYEMSKAVTGRKQKYQTAYFGWVKFEGAPELAKAIDAHLKESANILRYLVIKTVRENTMYSQRPMPVKADGTTVASPISETDMDKSIDKLLV